MTVGQPIQLATDQLLNIQQQQAGTQQPNIPVSDSPNQDIVINNKTENITKNKVYVPANVGGPIQGRPLQFRQQEAKAEQDLGKFKSWLNNKMARQKDLSDAKQREYRKRNVNLEKTQGKLSRILNNFGKRIDDSLNKNNANGLGLTLKGVLLIFGFGALARNWTSLMDGLTKLENRLINVFHSVRDDFKTGFFKNGVISKSLVKLFGGKEGETVGQALRKLLFDKDTGIFGYIRKLISDRLKESSAAVSKVEKPDLSFDDIKKPGQAIQKIANYLSEILAAILSPDKTAVTVTNNIAEKTVEKHLDQHYKLVMNNTSQVFERGFVPKGVKVSEGDRAIIKGGFMGLKPNALDIKGNLVDTESAYASQSSEIGRNIFSAYNGNINTASVGSGFARLYESAKNKDVIPVTRSFIDSIINSKEDLNRLGIGEPVEYNYVIRPKTDDELAFDLARVAKDDETLMKVLRGLGLFTGTVASGFRPLGAGLGYAFGNQLAKLGVQIDQAGIPRYTTELRKPGKPLEANEKVAPEKPLVYELNKEQLENIIKEFIGNKDIDIDVNNREFLEAVNKKLETLSRGKVASREISNFNDVYAVNDLVAQNKVDEANMLNNLRLQSSIEHGNEAFSEMGDYFANSFDNLKQAWNNTENPNAGSSNVDSSLWDRAMETWRDVKEWSSSTPTPSSSKDAIDKVVALSKTGLFYSNESDYNKEGIPGPWSKHGHGYIPLGTRKYKGKCTSGPATFYHDALGINLNAHWWKPGYSYYNTPGTDIGKVGFKKIWWGTKEQGCNTQAILNTGFQLEKGDILLNFVEGLAPTAKHPGGKSAHAQMWNGEQWVSDTYQGNGCWPYGAGSRGRLGNESCQIWRFLPDGSIPTEEVNYNYQASEENTVTPAEVGVADVGNETDFSNYSNNSSETATSETAEETKKSTSEVPLIYSPSYLEQIASKNLDDSLEKYKPSSVGINNFETNNDADANLTTLNFIKSNTTNKNLREQYEKVVNIAYNSLDNIAEKLGVVIQNESICVATTNDMSEQV